MQNPGCQVALVTKLCSVVADVCGSSVWNVLHFICLAPKILKCLLGFLGNMSTFDLV